MLIFCNKHAAICVCVSGLCRRCYAIQCTPNFPLQHLKNILLLKYIVWYFLFPSYIFITFHLPILLLMETLEASAILV